MFVNTIFWSRNYHWKALLLNALLVAHVRESDTTVQGHKASRVVMRDGKEYHLPFDVPTVQNALVAAAGTKPGKAPVDLLLPPEPVEPEDATGGVTSGMTPQDVTLGGEPQTTY